MITTASKTQFVELPSVNLSFLRERGVVIRCSNFSVGALRKGGKKKSRKNADLLMTLPIITSDKATFNIPDDIHNPAFQVGVSLYFYPDKYGNKFLGMYSTVSMLLCHKGHFGASYFTEMLSLGGQ